MKIFKVLVQIAEDGSFGTCDAIEYNKRIWLVPQWLESSTQAATRPRRLIPLDIFEHQKLSPSNAYGADYSLRDPMPKQIFGEKISEQLATLFQVVELPDIEIPGGGGRMQ